MKPLAPLALTAAFMLLSAPAFAEERDDIIAGCEVELVTPTTDCGCLADAMISDMSMEVRELFLEITADMEEAQANIDELSARDEFDPLMEFMNGRMSSECNDE